LHARVLIVDDEPLARERIREMLKGDREIEIIGEARNGAEAVAAITTQSPDIVFLDVQMPDLNGFQVLKTLGVDGVPLVIFVTAFDQHALRAFDVHAVDYLMKPFDRKRFARAITHAKSRLQRPTGERDADRMIKLLEELTTGAKYLERLAIKVGEKTLFVRAAEIDSIEAEGNYLRVNAGASCHMLRETINSIESQLDPRSFVRIHRSTIVNINRVKELQAWARGEYRVLLDNGSRYTLSRGYRDHFDNFIKNR
jgi:two-component system, LytTR family, response regulator